MTEQLHTVYELQKILLGTPLSLAMEGDQNRIGTLVSSFADKKVYQQIRQPDVNSARTILSTTNKKSIVLPAHVFWPMVRNVAYIYNIKVVTFPRYDQSEFKFVFPASVKKKFDLKILTLDDDSTSSSHTFQLIMKRKEEGLTTEYFTNFMAKDQARLVCSSQPASLKLAITPHQVVFGPLPSPCLLDIQVENNERSVKARFNVDSYHLLKPYFMSIKRNLNNHLQSSQARLSR